MASKVHVHDDRLARAVADPIILGRAFAFLPERVFGLRELAFTRTLASPRDVTVSLFGAGAELPGVTLGPVTLPVLRLASITSDKVLYREGADVVRLLAVDALAAGEERELTVETGGVEHARLPLELGASGVAMTELRDLPAGAYVIRFAGAAEPRCEVTVATYRLAPLVASLLDRSLAGDRMNVVLRLETFGLPVDGAVTLELCDADRRVARETARCEGGTTSATFELRGEGPFTVNVQLVAQPERTATVPLVGTRAEERRDTVFSALGDEVLATLLPSEGSRLVRGIHLREGATLGTPFRLERVDTRRARLIATTAAHAVCLVSVDPTRPARDQGLDPRSAPHPAEIDELYRTGEQLFGEERWALAQGVFETARARQSPQHPNYAYYIACCHARLGHGDEALRWLGAAIADGWRDMDHIRADPDLASIRERPELPELLGGGVSEVRRERLAAGEALEIDVASPLGILAIGAYVDGKPWEGWAAAITPSSLAVTVDAPERCEPGARVAVTVSAKDASPGAVAWVLVKDARLASSDTPDNQLAARLKAVVDGCREELATHHPTDTLRARLPPPPPPFVAPPLSFGAPPRAFSAAAPGGPPVGGLPPPAMSPPSPSRGKRAAPPPRGAEGGAVLAGPYRKPPEPALTGDEPEVLFAGIVPLEGGHARLDVQLGDTFADYQLEAFVLDGREWVSAERKLRVVKDPFVSLDLPPFVHQRDGATGRVIAGAGSGRMRVSVTRDGEPVALFDAAAGAALGDAELETERAELSFVAGPGDYVASVVDPVSRASHAQHLRVEEPGKLRRLSRALHLLEPGQELRREGNVRALRILPGLKAPFDALVEATSDYGHACCEQTAAKMLAALAMLALAKDDRARRARAQGIFTAGVARERQMWLRGRGFKMYPDSGDVVNEYWGAKATRYLFETETARGLQAESRELRAGIEDALAMARDTAAAYGIPWPPARPDDPMDAYAIVRSDSATAAGRAALERARALATSPPAGQGVVAQRAEAAFGAAALLRGGQRTDLPVALELANRVVTELGEGGRLYSTVDSVAAIALMTELVRAGVGGSGDGELELDGEPMTTAQALAHRGDIERVRAHRGVIAVEVERLVEEDWSTFSSAVPLRIALEKNGEPARAIRVGDAVELRLRLEDGYEAGDLAWICLPDALTRVLGGGRLKRFSVDFQGRAEVSIPLAATAVTVGPDGAPAPQRFAACVRNMFAEERAGSPGLLEVTVTEASEGGGGGLLSRVRRLFS